MMILMNSIDKYKVDPGNDTRQIILNRSIKTIVLLLAPFTPHICEELWQIILYGVIWEVEQSW